MEPTPTPSAPKIPASQQEAHDTVLQYLQKTVDGLPPGTTLDTTQAGGGSNLSCDDDYQGPGPGPTDYTITTYVIGPAGVPPADLITKTGDLWRSWGLSVMERNGFEKPNQFGYPPDGYSLLIQAAYPPQYPPSLAVISPCFPGNLRKDGIPIPDIIHQSNPAN